jgi:hypothetical protein
MDTNARAAFAVIRVNSCPFVVKERALTDNLCSHREVCLPSATETKLSDKPASLRRSSSNGVFFLTTN